MSAADWDEVIGVMTEPRIPELAAHGLVTDGALRRIANLSFGTGLSLWNQSFSAGRARLLLDLTSKQQTAAHLGY